MDTETNPSSPVLTFKGSGLPVRISGVSIFVAVLIIYFAFQDVPVLILIISALFMLLAVFLAADITVTADNTARSLIIIKKRIIGSSRKEYRYDDIAFLVQNFKTVTDPKGQQHQKITYSVAVNNMPGTKYGFKGYHTYPLAVPTSFYSMLSGTVRDAQEYAHARSLANFMGKKLLSNGGPHDAAVNFAENIPDMVEGLGKVPDAMREAKKENDRMADEILRNQKN